MIDRPRLLADLKKLALQLEDDLRLRLVVQRVTFHGSGARGACQTP